MPDRPHIKNEIVDPHSGARIIVLAFRMYSQEETRSVAERYFRANPSYRLRPDDTLTISSLARAESRTLALSS